jgi:hypothetical protein
MKRKLELPACLRFDEAYRLIFICLIFQICGCISLPVGFTNYRVALSRVGVNAPLKIPPGLNWKMQSYLQTSGQDDGPDFADHYTLFQIS